MANPSTWVNGRAPYSDVYNYFIGNNQPTVGGGENGQGMFIPRDWASNEEISGFRYNRTGNESQNDYWSYDAPDKYKGVAFLENVADNQGAARWNNNYRALPGGGMTKFGPVENTTPFSAQSRLLDPNMYEDHPLYGRITAQRNINEAPHGFGEKLGAIIPKATMAAGGAWMGGLAMMDMGFGGLGGKALWNIGNQAAKMGLAGGIPGLAGPNNGPTGPLNTGKTNMGTLSSGYARTSGPTRDDPWGFQGEGPSSNNPGFDPYGAGGGPNYGGDYVATEGSDSGFNFGDIGNYLGNGFNSLVNGFGQGDQRGMAGGLMLPGGLAALQNWNQADKYRKLGEDAANRSDPFGSQRAQYAQRLSDTYSNPQAVLDDPQHRAVVDKQSNRINSRNRASGYMGSGKANMDLADYQAQADAQYLNHERDQLGNLAGAQFNPANAGNMMMQGGMLGLTSDKAALDAAMTPYLAYLQSQYAGNRVQGGGQMPGGGNPVRGGSTRGGSGGARGAAGQVIRNAPGLAGQFVGGRNWSGNLLNPDNPDFAYGPDSGWGQDVMNPENPYMTEDMYGVDSGWGLDTTEYDPSDYFDTGSSYIPEGGGDIWDVGGGWDDFDWSSIWGD